MYCNIPREIVESHSVYIQLSCIFNLTSQKCIDSAMMVENDLNM